MNVCRACGESWAKIQNRLEDVNKYVHIYSRLTAIELLQAVELEKIRFCKDCISKLDDIDNFRSKCVEVHQRLQEVKVEKDLQEEVKSITSEEIHVKVETFPEEPFVEDDQSNDDPSFDIGIDVNDVDDNEEGEDTDEDYKDDAADDEEEDLLKQELETDETKEPKPKKKRAKWGSLPKKEPKKPLEYLTCHLCPKKFVVQHRLDAHIRIHQGLKPFFCEICGLDFYKMKSQKEHMEIKHSDDFVRLTCDHPGCDRTFVNKLGLQRHFRKCHDPNYEPPEPTPFICDTCGKSFTTNGGLSRHKFIHAAADMPFGCETCGKKFTTKDKLKMHIARHQGIKNHVCSTCGYRFVTKDELKTHVRKTHEKHLHEKVPCDLCGALFSGKDGLRRHVKVVHLGIKPHICAICGAAFGQTDHLKRHMNSHKGATAQTSLSASASSIVQ